MFSLTFAEKVLQRALATGADFAELYLEDGTSHELSLEDVRVDFVSSTRRTGAGVRVFSGTQTAYAYCSSWEPDAILKAADQAAQALAAQGITRQETRLAPFQKVCSFREYADPYEAVPAGEKLALMRDMVRICHDYSPEIKKVSVRFGDFDRRILVFNSEGVWAEDRRTRGRLFISPVAEAEGRLMAGMSSPGAGRDYSFFRERDWEADARKAAEQAVTMLHAPECPAGTVPVVIENGFGGVIFHEACGHSLESAAVAYNNSEFAGKLGQKIAADCVSAVDDGTLDGEWGSAQVDDEGHKTQRNLLIEKGVCKSYLVDRLGSRLMGLPATGSGRREDYTYAATSRMTNTFILNGEDDGDEMIRSLPEGLYAKSMAGGSVNPLTGEFNFAVREGYWIKNGELVTPVRGATLIGTGGEVLLRIDRVAKNLEQAQGMCGASSGSIPANVGQPRLRVSEMIVGGSGGAI